MKISNLLMDVEMVRATLREIDKPGTGKTQTRRIVKHIWPHLNNEPYYATGEVLSDLPTQPGAFMEFRHREWDKEGYQGSGASILIPCPYGKPGDLIYVRENYFIDIRNDKNKVPQEVIYDATPEWALDFQGKMTRVRYIDGALVSHENATKNINEHKFWKRKPSIHQPRWASRITLEITDVRVERLQDISEEDAMAEGINWWESQESARTKGSELFRNLWESIYGPGSWELNSWVWTISFKPHLMNVDSMVKIKEIM